MRGGGFRVLGLVFGFLRLGFVSEGGRLYQGPQITQI